MTELCLNNVLEINDSEDIKILFSRRIVKETKLYNNKSLANKEYYTKNKSDKIKTKLRLDSDDKMSEDRSQRSDNMSQSDIIEANKLATYFEKYRLLENGIDTRELQKWVIEIYKLVKIDKESWNEIDRVIRWVLADDFWKTVVHSPLKFRRKDKEGIRYWDKFKQLSKANRKGRTIIEGETDYNKGNML